jgi:hypothetical protein
MQPNNQELINRLWIALDNEEEVKQTVQVWSRDRQITAEQIGDMWKFVEQFVIEQDIFAPTSIDERYLLGSAFIPKSGERYRVQNPGTVLVLGDKDEAKYVPDLVRVDYFRFGK